MAALTGQRLIKFQTRMNDIKLLIIDEKSMVGLAMFGKVIRRLREARPGSKDFFAGFCLIILGDFSQLPPVGGRAFYSPQKKGSKNSPDAILGEQGYAQFTESIELVKIYRQADDEQSTRFKAVLNALRLDTITDEDFEFLSSQFISRIAPAELKMFDSALRLFAKRDQVKDYNDSKLLSSGLPCVRVKSINTGTGANSATDDEAQGLPSEVVLMKGAKVMLISNLWTDQGKLKLNAS